MKQKFLTLVAMSLFLVIFIGCEKDDEIQPETTITTPVDADISGASEDALQAYVDQLMAEGFSEEEVTLKLEEYIKDQNAKGINYTYRVNSINIASWMCETKNIYDRADWADRGYPYEPITNMWKDNKSTSKSQALQKITNHLKAVGYGKSLIHTGKYYGQIDGTWSVNAYPYMVGFYYTWSDDYWWNDNNHGRVFGPVKVGNYWISIASFSREEGGSHDFINFYQARNKAAGYSSYFPYSRSLYSGNTWADGYSYVKICRNY